MGVDTQLQAFVGDGVMSVFPNQRGQSSTLLLGYYRWGNKHISVHGQCPLDIDSNVSLCTDAEGNSQKDAATDEPPKPKRQKTISNEDKRNMASCARLFKLNKLLVLDQKGVFIKRGFEGLLDLAASSMPGDISQWILKYYDRELLQIVIPDRGKIHVDAASVHGIWGLPNRGRKVCYKNQPDITKEFYKI
ncbi:hypothetical protein D1007_27321 [Hordeum vulgare]|nr:hypothetical protein D1007_27321 [Hordeum vulgare]